MGRFAPSSLVLNVPNTRTQAAATAVVHAARLRSAKASASGAQIAMAQLVIWNRAETGVQFCDHRSEEHTSELQSHSDLVCRLLLEKKKKKQKSYRLSNKPST